MPFIKVIHPDEAEGRLKQIYDKVTGPNGQVDNVLQIHSLRPHTLEGHMALYKAVLHHPRNDLPKWFLEAIGVLVSLLNDCSYCAKHHAAGMKRLLSKEPEKFEACHEQLHRDHPAELVEQAVKQALEYGCVQADGVELCLRQLLNPDTPVPALSLADLPTWAMVGEQPPDLTCYDQLLERV